MRFVAWVVGLALFGALVWLVAAQIVPGVRALPDMSKSTDPLYYWRFLVQILEMLGVVGAVVLALWDKLRHLLVRPKLAIDFRDPSNTITEEEIETAEGKKAVQFCCDLALQNTARVPATACRLAFAECHIVAGSQLVAFSKPLRAIPAPWPNDRETIEIRRGLPARLRVFTVTEQSGTSPTTDSQSGARTETLAVLQVPLLQEEGTSDPLVLPAGEYKLRLAFVTDRDIRADIVLHITYRGIWHDRLPNLKQVLSVSKVKE